MNTQLDYFFGGVKFLVRKFNSVPKLINQVACKSVRTENIYLNYKASIHY